MKKWKCLICGYIHEGDAPPEVCPICKAPASKFVELTPEEAALATVGKRQVGGKKRPVAPKKKISDKERIAALEAEVAQARRRKNPLLRTMDALLDQMVRHHAHPVSVHLPNGLLPVGVLFFILALLFHVESLATAGFYNVIAVFLALPLVIFAGFVEWVKKYNSALTMFFKIKITAAGVTFLGCLISCVWYLKDPEVLHSSYAWLFILVNVVMLGAAGVAGHLGGKLVFKD